MPKIAAEWKIAAINLDFDASAIKIIRQKCGWNDPEGCCLEMLMEWLTTGKEGPKTWNTLLSALKMNRNFTNVCSDIEKKLREGMHLQNNVITIS